MFFSFHRASVLAVSAVVVSSIPSLSVQGKDDEEASTYELEDFVVEAQQFSRVDKFSIVSFDYVEEAELQRMVQATLGETLAWQPGVSSSYFGPGSSRPVIRGFEGYRVRMLQDSIGTLDVSESSPDHGVALEPLLIREIDIYRGPSALLFGNSAIGGAVNATSRNILDELPSLSVTGSFEARYESVNSGESFAGYTHLTLEEFVITLTSAIRESDNYDIPGRARTEEYDASFDPPPVVGSPPVPVENPSGTLPNTFHKSDSWSAGLMWLPEKIPVKIGGAFSQFDSEYGLPYQYPGGPTDDFGFSSLSLRHERFDVDARIELPQEWSKELHFHFGYADYSHVELFTGQGVDADTTFEDTMFDQHALEGRLEWFHQITDQWEGVIGAQVQQQDVKASFLRNRIRTRPENLQLGNSGIFALETFKLEAFTLQIGSRYEAQTAETLLPNPDIKTTGKSFSHAGSLTWRRKDFWFLDELSVTPAVSLIERIPTATENFVFWENPAIQRFLIGGYFINDGNALSNEESFGLEIGIETHIDNWSGNFNAYRYDYDNFIFLQDIAGFGNLAGYVESEALFYGFEGEISWSHQLSNKGNELTFTVMSDYVRGQNEDTDDPLPRITPLRVGTRLELQWQRLDAGLEYRYAFKQDRVQPGGSEARPDLVGVRAELETDSYSELNFDMSYNFDVSETTTLTTFLRATNLLNEERRIHTSFIKDVAPLPGRNISLGLRTSF